MVESPEHSTRRAAPPPRLTVRKQAAFAIIAVLLILGFLEVGVRAYHFVRNVGSPEEPRGYVVQDPEVGYTLKRGYEGGGIRVDSLGFRGPEIQTEKASETFRIVAIGDSATFGPHEEECSYPYLLPGLLAPRKVESINAAIEGYRTDHALIHLRRDVLPLKPDLVTVYIGWNDLYQTDPQAEKEELSIRGNPLAQLLTFSDVAQTFRRLYFARFQSQRAQMKAGATDDASWLGSYVPEGYGERLRTIYRVARASGASVVTLTWPTLLSNTMSPEALGKAHYPWYTTSLAELKSLYQRYQQVLRRVAAEEGVPVVDAAAAFDGQDKVALFKDTAHFSCTGQTLVAETLAARLRDGLLSGGAR